MMPIRSWSEPLSITWWIQNKIREKDSSPSCSFNPLPSLFPSINGEERVKFHVEVWAMLYMHMVHNS